MTISLDALCKAIKPSRTTLVLGAGASMPSGAPSGAALAAHLWKTLTDSEPQSDDLAETATILERRFSRRPVVDCVIRKLTPLQPTGGLLGLPKLGWKNIFTTNFDRLMEIAYQRCGIPAVPIRSNFDFTSKEAQQGTRIFKIHGCISQDKALGDRASMILTEADYENHTMYRQVLFSNLAASLYDGDVLVLGQSLRDRHLIDLVKDVLRAKQDEGAPGQVYSLVYSVDDLRAPLLEDRGARVVFGGIDEFVHAMANTGGIIDDEASYDAEGVLPVSIVSTVLSANQEIAAAPNVLRMFNGGAATYADIKAGVSFERLLQAEAVHRLLNKSHSVTIVGAAGVGKSTLARQIAAQFVEQGVPVWEHRAEFPFQHKPWASIEAQFRAKGRFAVLVLDECTHFLRQANALIDYLGSVSEPGLRLVMTANSAQWAPRLKSPHIFSNGLVIELSQLAEPEINSLVNLVQHNNLVASLVHADFRKLTRQEQLDALRLKCSADMFVCLKNIFANESLDTILLREFEELDVHLQEYYRYVAALEAVGTRVHRQLMVRMLAMQPDQVTTILTGLSGIVDEYDIAPKEGIYGWRTRHLVIARRITDYKFSGIAESTELFEKIIDNINPSVPLELQTIREICDAEFGIGRIANAKVRQRLYRRLIAAAPGERIPWHRLIRELLTEGLLDDTEYVIRDAERAAGSDAPIDRYKVRLLVVRSKNTAGISEVDRIALLRRAYEQAMANTARHKWDKYSYYTVCDVAMLLLDKGESGYILEEAIAHAKKAAEIILDPEMTKRIREYEDVLARRR